MFSFISGAIELAVSLQIINAAYVPVIADKIPESINPFIVPSFNNPDDTLNIVSRIIFMKHTSRIINKCMIYFFLSAPISSKTFLKRKKLMKDSLLAKSQLNAISSTPTNKNITQNAVFERIKPIIEPEVIFANIKIKTPINKAAGTINKSNATEYLNPLYKSLRILTNGKTGFSFCSISALTHEKKYPMPAKLITEPKIKNIQYCQGIDTAHPGHGGRIVCA